MTSAILVIKEDEDEVTRKIIDYIADNIDKVISMYDIRILKYDDIGDLTTKADIRGLPCLHVNGINYHRKNDIMSMLSAGKVERVSDDVYDNIIRGLHELPADELAKPIIEDNLQSRIDDERSRRITSDKERRGALTMPPGKKIIQEQPEVVEPARESKTIHSITPEIMLNMLKDD